MIFQTGTSFANTSWTSDHVLQNHDAVYRFAHPPASSSALWRVPVVERDQQLDPVPVERIDQPVVGIEPCARCTRAAGLQNGGGHATENR